MSNILGTYGAIFQKAPSLIKEVTCREGVFRTCRGKGNAIYRSFDIKVSSVSVPMVHIELLKKLVRTFPVFVILKGFAYVQASVKIPGKLFTSS